MSSRHRQGYSKISDRVITEMFGQDELSWRDQVPPVVEEAVDDLLEYLEYVTPVITDYDVRAGRGAKGHYAELTLHTHDPYGLIEAASRFARQFGPEDVVIQRQKTVSPGVVKLVFSSGVP